MRRSFLSVFTIRWQHRDNDLTLQGFLRFLPPANEVWSKVIFLYLSVILFTMRWEYLSRYPPQAGTSPLGRYPPGRYNPTGQVHPPAGTPLGQVHPQGRYTPRSSAFWEIRATSGWYASYWNAFLFEI